MLSFYAIKLGEFARELKINPQIAFCENKMVRKLSSQLHPCFEQHFPPFVISYSIRSNSAFKATKSLMKRFESCPVAPTKEKTRALRLGFFFSLRSRSLSRSIIARLFTFLIVCSQFFTHFRSNPLKSFNMNLIGHLSNHFLENLQLLVV